MTCLRMCVGDAVAGRQCRENSVLAFDETPAIRFTRFKSGLCIKGVQFAIQLGTFLETTKKGNAGFPNLDIAVSGAQG